VSLFGKGCVINAHRTMRSVLLDWSDGNDHDRRVFERFFQLVTVKLSPRTLSIGFIIGFAVNFIAFLRRERLRALRSLTT
jgi:hypothetical protein